MPFSDRTSWLLWLLIAAASVSITLFVVTTTISLDDPFIGLRYADNFVAGHGIVYNPHDPPVEGYTALLWILVAALGIALGFEPLGFWQCVAIPMNVLTLLLLFQLGRREGQPLRRALLAPALLGCFVGFVTYPITGMETACLVFLTTLAVFMIDRGMHLKTGGAIALGGVLFLMCLDRFDAMILVSLILAPQLLVDREIKRSLPTIAVLGAAMVIYNLWRYSFYGDWLPNTFYTKTSTLGEQLWRGVRYTGGFTLKGGPYFLLLFLFPFVWRRCPRIVLISAWVAVMHLLYVTVVGGDWMPDYRFILPVAPLLCLILQESVWIVSDKVSAARVSDGQRRAVLGLVIAGMLALNILPYGRSETLATPGENAWFIPTHAKEIGEALNDKLPPDALVAVEWAGIIPFYLQQPVLDIFGLSDKDIIEGDFPGAAMGKGITPEYLKGRDPAVFLFCGRHYETRERAEIGIECRKGHDHIYELSKAMTAPEMGYEVCIARVGEAYYPLLIKSSAPYKDELTR